MMARILLIALIIILIALIVSLAMYTKSPDKNARSKWLVTSILLTILGGITYFFYKQKKDS